jgi:DNA replication protein DnaC
MYPPYAYEYARGELENRRDNAGIQAETRYERCAASVPEFAAIRAELAKCGAGVAKAIAADPNSARAEIENLRSRSLLLRQRRVELLAKMGLPFDYLDTVYTCRSCHDTGYISGHQCACMKELLVCGSLKYLTGTDEYDRYTFDNFKLDIYSDIPLEAAKKSPRYYMKNTLDYCRNYAYSFTPKSPSLFLTGNTGLGKTFMSLIIACEVTKRGYHAVFESAQSLLNKIEREKFQREYSQSDELERALNAQFLVIDDLGSEFRSAFAMSALYGIINGRLSAKRPTIINTNISQPELQKTYDQRLTSRLLFDCKTLPFEGRDIRQLLGV